MNTWVIVALTPAYTVRRATHPLARSEQGVDAFATVCLLDLDGVVLVVGSKAEAVRDEGAEHGTMDPAIAKKSWLQCAWERRLATIIRIAGIPTMPAIESSEHTALRAGITEACPLVCASKARCGSRSEDSLYGASLLMLLPILLCCGTLCSCCKGHEHQRGGHNRPLRQPDCRPHGRHGSVHFLRSLYLTHSGP